MEYCARVGVELSPSARVLRRSAGISVVLNFHGDRAFVTHIPPRPDGEQPEIGRWREVPLQPSTVDALSWCYLHAGRGVADFLRDARKLGTKVVLDVSLGDERYRDTVIECVTLADVFVPNENELLRLTRADSIGRAVTAAAAWGTQLVVKRGEVAEGVRQVTVRDLTGAGDTFAGAMIAALLRGAPLTQAVVAGNAAGSEAVNQLGAVGEVEVAGMSTAGPTPGPAFLAKVAASAAEKAAKEPDR